MTVSDHVYDVVICGGGLGGLALAIALEELGLDWQLCEAAEELRCGVRVCSGRGGRGTANPNRLGLLLVQQFSVVHSQPARWLWGTVSTCVVLSGPGWSKPLHT